MGCYGNTLHDIVRGEAEVRGISERPIRIGDSCIIEVNERFFLLVEILFDNVEIVVVIRISRTQATNLMREGVRHCPVFMTLPEDIRGRSVMLQTVFVVGDQAFLVFETEREAERFERLFVIRTPLTQVINREC